VIPTVFRFEPGDGLTRAALPAGPDWVRFGDDVLFVGDEPPPAEHAARAHRRHPGPVHRQDLHVVTQVGAVFERTHPEVPIVLDKGRYLVVALEPTRAAELGRAAHDFAIHPLEGGSVVFETRPRGVARRAPSAAVQALVGRLDRAELETVLSELVSLPTRHSTSTHFRSAARSARARLESLGYGTRTESVAVGSRKSQNVVADLPGTATGARELVVVVAHLDSVNHLEGPSGSAPGADDNASGAAGLLEMARVLGQHGGRHDLRLVLFGGEEQGLFGSRHHVARLAADDARRIRAVVNMDMIGTTNTPTPTVLLEGSATSQALLDGLAEAAAAHTTLSVQTSLNPFNSDHVPFLDAGIPAVLTIEGADSSNHAVHTAGDTLDRVDRELLLAILRMNVAFVATSLGVGDDTTP
jgi:hypothetical protein